MEVKFWELKFKGDGQVGFVGLSVRSFFLTESRVAFFLPLIINFFIIAIIFFSFFGKKQSKSFHDAGCFSLCFISFFFLLFPIPVFFVDTVYHHHHYC